MSWQRYRVSYWVREYVLRFHEAIHGVYFDDLDAFKILHNSKYLLLFERTIGSFWARIGWGNFFDHDSPDRWHLVRANHIEYLRPVTEIGEVRVRVWIEKLGTSSLTFGFRMLPMDQDVNYATGTRVLVRIDPETRKPAPWTDEFRQRVAPYLQEHKA